MTTQQDSHNQQTSNSESVIQETENEEASYLVEEVSIDGMCGVY